MLRRERILAAAVGVLVGGWLLDSALIGPGLAWYDRVRSETRKAGEEAAQAQALVDRQSRIMADWRSRHAAGLLDDESAARFRLQRTLADAARSGGLALDNVSGGQLIPAGRDETCDTIRLTATGQGGLAQAMAFIAALASAPQALRIERSELSASDARKDLLEVSLTVSTRIVPAKARSGRGIPDGTAPWAPEPADRATGEAVVAAKPFLGERRAPSARGPAPDDGAKAAPAAAPGGWALVGIVARDGGAVAFMRHLGDGRERLLAAGEDFEGRAASAVDADGLVLGTGDAAQRIAVGTQLDGTPVPSGGVRTAAAAPAGAAPGSSPAPITDSSRESILERLRQQRNRTP